jgi:hypothetical protein
MDGWTGCGALLVILVVALVAGDRLAMEVCREHVEAVCDVFALACCLGHCTAVV